MVVTILADPAVAATTRLATCCWSWALVAVTLLMSVIEEGIAVAAPGVSLLVWPTFRAVVDSEIAPVLNFGFGLAWIPV